MASVPLAVIAATAAILASQPKWEAVDGDTLRRGDETVRLEHIDAPELSQTCGLPHGGRYPCGKEARDTLAALIVNGVACSYSSKDKYGRSLATCATADGDNINAAMVMLGQAWAYVQYGGDRYAASQAIARQIGAGLWIDPAPIAPWAWRRGQRPNPPSKEK